MGRNISNHSESPVRGRGSPHRKSPSRRERSPARHRSSHRGGSPAREKHRGDVKSPKQERSASPKSRSLSPRTKRLRGAQAERDVEGEQERSHGRGSKRNSQRERGSEKETGSERKERRSGRDDADGKSSRSRRGRSTSPSDHNHKSRRRSHSPQPALDGRSREGVKGTERDYERNHSKGSDRDTQRERGLDREREGVRTERRSGRDDPDQRSSRSKHGRSISPSDQHHRNKHTSRSPADARARDEGPTSRGADYGNDEIDSISKMQAAEEALEAKKKEQPSFELSGKLAAETNRVRGVTLLFNEPPDARKPNIRWRLYVFKNGEVLNEPLYIHRQSCYLFGRERRVADIPTDHPSCSKQHAIIQFRQVEKEKLDGMLAKQIRPYLMDLGSTNKTFLNEVAIEPQRYYELFEKDTIKFGNSSREYVLLHENSTQ
ncbi:FHA domain-containing protein DDL [Morus notabilis]|uniref:FHA domain-containing protein DDL n=1 Tax=Morus notabilis TaxID=981085 RepID=UPI000CED78C0|nr:FHA domain-containing protein DDL [Morus notabilis]